MLGNLHIDVYRLQYNAHFFISYFPSHLQHTSLTHIKEYIQEMMIKRKGRDGLLSNGI